MHVARRPDGSRRVVAVAEPVVEAETAAAVRVNELTSPEGRLIRLPKRPQRAAHVSAPSEDWIEL